MKLQYFGHLMRRSDSLEKTLMLGKTESGRRRGRQRMRWLEGIADSMDMLLLLLLLLSRFSCVRLFVTPWTAAHQASLSITNSLSLLKLMSIKSMMPSNHLILCHPLLPFLSRLQSFPASGSFKMSQFFPSGGQSIRVSVSASVLPMNIQGRFPLGWTGLIALQSKGLSRVFSNTTVQKHQFFGAQLSL